MVFAGTFSGNIDTFYSKRDHSVMTKKILGFISLFAVFNFLDYRSLGDIFRQGKFRYMFLSLVPLTFFYIKDKLHWTLAFFASYMLFSWVIHDYQISGIMSLTITFGVMTFTAFMLTIEKEMLAELMIFFGSFQAIFALLQWHFGHFLFTPKEEWGLYLTTGTYGHNTILGPFLACCLAPALWKGQWIWAVLITFICVISKSTMTAGSVAAVYLIFLWSKTSFKMAFYVGLTGIVLLAIGYKLSGGGHVTDRVGDNFYAFNGRFTFWKAAWKAFLEHPIFGGGIGSWVSTYTMKYIGNYQDTLVLQVHNDYLEYLVEYGSAPFIVLAGGLVEFIRGFRPTWHHAVCVAVMVDALGNFPFQIVPIALLFCVCLVHSMVDSDKILNIHGGF